MMKLKIICNFTIWSGYIIEYEEYMDVLHNFKMKLSSKCMSKFVLYFLHLVSYHEYISVWFNILLFRMLMLMVLFPCSAVFYHIHTFFFFLCHPRIIEDLNKNFQTQQPSWIILGSFYSRWLWLNPHFLFMEGSWADVQSPSTNYKSREGFLSSRITQLSWGWMSYLNAWWLQSKTLFLMTIILSKYSCQTAFSSSFSGSLVKMLCFSWE